MLATDVVDVDNNESLKEIVNKYLEMAEKRIVISASKVLKHERLTVEDVTKLHNALDSILTAIANTPTFDDDDENN